MACSMLSNNHLLKNVNDTFNAFVNQKGCLSFFVAGKTGAGKSPLVNALLGKRVAVEGHQKNPCSASVKLYHANIEGTDIRVYDSPGLQDGKCEYESYLESLAREVRKELDVMLYCIKMDDRRFYDEDKNAIRALTRQFGTDVWKNAVIALTFANNIEDPDGGDKQVFFQCDYKSWRCEINAFLAALGLDSTIREAIPILPVGNFTKPQLPTTENWFSDFWSKCFDRIEDPSRMNLYQINRSRLAFPGAASMEAACFPGASEEEGQTELAAEPDTTQSANEDRNIPREIPLNEEQQEQFWTKTLDAFRWYCIHILRKPEVVADAVAVGFNVLGLKGLGFDILAFFAERIPNS